jgi:hypothetical protein
MEIVMLWLSLIKSNFRVRSCRHLNARVDTLCAAVLRGCDLAKARGQRGAGRLNPFTRRQITAVCARRAGSRRASARPWLEPDHSPVGVARSHARPPSA